MQHEKHAYPCFVSMVILAWFGIYRVIFFNWASPEHVSRLAPPKNALTAPPPPHFEKVLSMAAERGEIPNTLKFLMPRGGQSLAGPVKKNHPVNGTLITTSLTRRRTMLGGRASSEM